MDVRDRLDALRSSTTLNGIDFVEIASAQQTRLRVHFHNAVQLQGTLDATTPATITGGETLPTVAVLPIAAGSWSTDVEGRPLLTLEVEAPGDFSFYTFTLFSPRLDPYFDSAVFSFKALCHSDLDCEAPPSPCPPLPDEAPPIDYLAKDFLSFRQALSDFSALRYPEWVERSEADFGVMFMEALCSLADDLSYMQDRIAAEAALETATQRRSIVRHARLVDYEPHPTTASRVLLQLEVTSGPVPPGLPISAPAPDGGTIPFETGTRLADPDTGLLNETSYPVDARWNRWKSAGTRVPNIPPYWWDDSRRCLRAGSTEMWVEGQGFGFEVGDPGRGTQGTAILIDTRAENPADPPVREIIHLTEVTPQRDELFGIDVTRLRWSAQEALRSDHDLTRTEIAGNIVPATQGRRHTETFAAERPPSSAPHTPLAVTRTGPNSTPEAPVSQYLYTLGRYPLAWLAPGEAPVPEIVLSQPPVPPSSEAKIWRWRRTLLDADRFEDAFTLEPARYAPIARNPDGSTSAEYDGDQGETIRFGDGVFGEIPEPARNFEVTYRAGGGAEGNVAADTITLIDPSAKAMIISATNPFPAEGGEDEETDQQVRRRAPEAFRAVQHRAVRPEDYVRAAKTLPWVQNAGTVFRWTGSWLTVFTTADPKVTERISVEQHRQLIDLLNRYRLAGYESYTPGPRYAPLDLIIRVCARAEAFRGDVEEGLLKRLSARTLPEGTLGFFHPDNFTFGAPLERSALEAAIQRAHGVAGVVSIRYRQRGRSSAYIEMPDEVSVGPDEIVRMSNDPSAPEHGSLRVIVEGGK
jgi:hypothetical protein